MTNNLIKYLVGFVIASYTLCVAAESVTYTGNLLNNIFVDANDTAVFDSATVFNSITLYNLGTVTAVTDIDVASGATLTVQTVHPIAATFDLQNVGLFVQNIENESEIHKLTVINVMDDMPCSISVDNHTNGIPLSFASIFNIANTGAVIDIAGGSSLVLDTQSNANDVNLNGMGISLYVDLNNAGDTVVLHNVKNHSFGLPDIVVMHPSKLFWAKRVLSGDDLIVTYVRETDYTKIFDDARGTLLQELRENGMDQGLFTQLDGAASMREIDTILERSARFNPIKLMTPIKMFNMFEVLDTRFYDGNTYAFASAGDVLSSDFNIPFAKLGVNIAVMDNLDVTLSGYAGMLDNSDEFDAFRGTMYGGNITANYDSGLLVGTAVAGLTMTNFDSGPVLGNNEIVRDPTGTSEYFMGRVGMRVFSKSGLGIVPYVGAVHENISILNDSESSVRGLIGADVKFLANAYSVGYEYGLRTNILTDGLVDLMATMQIDLPADDIWFDIGLGMIYDDGMFGYKAAANVGLKF